jgi:hypothetical protein
MQLLTANQESGRGFPRASWSQGQQNLVDASVRERPTLTQAATSNIRGEAQKAIIQHTHHHHYWVRSSSAPARTTRLPSQPSRRYSNEEPIPVTAAESDSFLDQLPSKLHAEHHAEHRVPAKSSRHRYIIGTPPQSDAAPVKVISDGFSRRRADWREEHTHVHIYVPSNPGETESDDARRNPARTPIFEAPGDNEGKHSISSTPAQLQKGNPTRETEQRQSRTWVRPKRTRRHRRSFQG